MGDIVGRLFREFAVTLSVTILVSAAVSLTLTPMMCARLLKHHEASEQSRFARAAERVFDRVVDFYRRTLEKVLEHQPLTLAVAVATLLLTILLYVVIPKGFFPVQDTGVILGISEAPQSVSFSTMADRQQALAREILKDPAVASLSSFIGVDGTNATLNSGRIQINLKPLDERKTRASDIIRRLQPALAQVSGITLYMQPVQELTVEDRVSRTQYQYSLEDPDSAELAEWSPKLVAALQKRPELADVATDQQNRGLRTTLVFDRSTMSRLGITPQAVDDALYDAFGQRQVSTMFTQLNQYRVVLEVDPSFQTSPRTSATSTSAAPPRLRHGARDGRHGRADRGGALGVEQRRAALGLHDRAGVARHARHQPPGAVPGGHDLLQPGPGRLPRPGRQGHRGGARGDRPARQRSRPASRARRARSAPRS